MANKIYFITGGARSGKSAFAEKIANGSNGKRAYIATAQALDPEMAERIKHHKDRRGSSWDTYEEPLAVAELLRKLSGMYQTALLDCLTLWLNNVMTRSHDDALTSKSDELIHAIKNFYGDCIIVSNEVGLGIVPDNPLARKFRDYAGILNQRIAEAADEAYFMTSGIPVRIK